MPHCSICESAPATLIRIGRHEVCQPCLERVSVEVAARGLKTGRLAKIRQGREIAGVCGGIADALNMDRNSFRLIFVLATIFTFVFPLMFSYLILAWLLPSEPDPA